jgi:hypothetical protein
MKNLAMLTVAVCMYILSWAAFIYIVDASNTRHLPEPLEPVLLRHEGKLYLGHRTPEGLWQVGPGQFVETVDAWRRVDL